MIELVIYDKINKGYKVVLPKNMNVRLPSKYAKHIYTNPDEVKPNDKLEFIGWVSASNDDRSLWKKYLEV